MTMIDGDSVRPFIWLFYIPLMAWGFYATLVAADLQMLGSTLGPVIYSIWEFAPIPGTLSVMIGLVLRHGGSALTEISRPLLYRDWLGLWMQFGGHSSMCLVLVAYEVSTISEASWGQPVISTFALSSYALGTALLALQCLRKIIRAEQLSRSSL